MKNKNKIIIGGIALVIVALVAYSFMKGDDSTAIEAKKEM